jgi:predicted nucleotidyltransferase component of viral defense system
MFHLSTVDPATLELLKQVFTYDFVKTQFALAGGTALALQTGHRKSIDLDIFSEKAFIPTDIQNALAGIKNWHYEPTGRSERMLFCFINKIKCDFVNEPFPLLEPFFEEQGVMLYSLKDIAAMKMHTVCGRGKKKDFFDIYVLLQLFSWQEMLGWFEQKYGASQLFFLWKSISYFDDAESDPNVVGFEPYTATWEEIKKVIIATCQ